MFNYLLGLPTSSLLTSGGVGAAGHGSISLGLALPLIYQCLITYLAFPLHPCWHPEGLVQQDTGPYLLDLLYHSSNSVYLPTRPSHFILADIRRGWCSRTRVHISWTCSTTHLPVFNYLLGLPTSSLLTSGGVGAAGHGSISLGLALPLIYQCLITYLAFPLHPCWHLEGLVQQDTGPYLLDLLYHSSNSAYLPTWPSYFISADIWRGRWLWEECINVFTTHLPVFTYLLGLPTSSLLTSGGVGGFEKNVSMSLPLIYQCLLTYSVFPLHLCWHLEG